MAGDWMKIEKVTPDKPEILEIAGIVGLHHDEVFGKLYRLWSWADDQTEDGNARGVTLALLDSRIGVTGFAKAMETVGWLEQVEPSCDCPRGGVRFVNFDRHNGQTAKARALTASRVAKCKKNANAKGNALSVTNALPREEKRREEKREGESAPALEMKRGAGTPAVKALVDSKLLPDAWLAPSVLAALGEWCDAVFRVEGRQLDQVRLHKQLKDCAGWSADRLVRSIDKTIAKGGSRQIYDADERPAKSSGNRNPEPSYPKLRPISEC